MFVGASKEGFLEGLEALADERQEVTTITPAMPNLGETL